MRLNFLGATAVPALVLAASTASAGPVHFNVAQTQNSGFEGLFEESFGHDHFLTNLGSSVDFIGRVGFGFYTYERETVRSYETVLQTGAGRERVEIEGLSPEPRGQGHNFAPDDSTIGVWQVNDNGVRSCMAAGMIATEKTYQPAEEMIEAIQAGMTVVEAAASIPDVGGSHNAPIFEYHRYEDGSSDARFWAGFGIDPMSEELSEGDAIIEINGQSFEAEIVRDLENNYKLLVEDESVRNMIAETILEADQATTVRILSDNDPQVNLDADGNGLIPKVVTLNMQGTVDVREAMDACMAAENDVKNYIVPSITLTPVDVDFSDQSIEAMLGAQCLKDYTPEDVEQVLQVDGATGMLVRASHAFQMTNGTTLIGDYYENGPNGEFVSKSWQDDAETSCAGGNRIEITYTADQVAQVVTGQEITRERFTERWERDFPNTGLITFDNPHGNPTHNPTTNPDIPFNSNLPIPPAGLLLGSALAGLFRKQIGKGLDNASQTGLALDGMFLAGAIAQLGQKKILEIKDDLVGQIKDRFEKPETTYEV